MYASVPEPEAIVGQAVQMGDVTYTIVACGHKQATLQSPGGTRVKRSSPAIRKLFATGPVADEEKGAFSKDPEYEEVEAELVDDDAPEEEDPAAADSDEEDDEDEEEVVPPAAKVPRTEKNKAPKKRARANKNREILFVDARKGSPCALASDGKLPKELVYRLGAR